MTMLRDLLTTWENWSARDTLVRALATSSTDGSQERLAESIAEMPATSALDALRDGAELIDLLAGWQWQAVYAARKDGASWEEIGAATRTTDELARTLYVAILDRQTQVLGRDVSGYREAL